MDNSTSKSKFFLIMGIFFVLLMLFSLGASLYRGKNISTVVLISIVMASVSLTMWNNLKKKKVDIETGSHEAEDK